MESDPRLHRILRRLVIRSFPRLRHLPVSISWGAGDDMLCYTVQGNEHLIHVHDSLRPARRRVLEGGIAHELCHIDADLRMGPFQRELAWDRYEASRWCRMREERATERRVIELGYGPQLLAFVRFSRRLGYSFGREHGLLYPEIRALVRDAPGCLRGQVGIATDRTALKFRTGGRVHTASKSTYETKRSQIG